MCIKRSVTFFLSGCAPCCLVILETCVFVSYPNKQLDKQKRCVKKMDRKSKIHHVIGYLSLTSFCSVAAHYDLFRLVFYLNT